MATGSRTFAADSVGSSPSGITLLGIGTGTGNVESVTGAQGGKALVLRPQTGNRWTHAIFDAVAALSATDFELRARLKAPAGAQSFLDGAGISARWDYTGSPTGCPRYAGHAVDGGLAIKEATTVFGGTDLVTNTAFSLPVDGWWQMRFSVQGSSLKVWSWLDADPVKVNTDTPDISTTDTTITTGASVSVMWDTNDGSTYPLIIDYLTWGTGGDAAPGITTGPPPTLLAPRRRLQVRRRFVS